MTKETTKLVIVWLALTMLLGGTLAVLRYVVGVPVRHRTIPVIHIDVRDETAQHWLRHFHELLQQTQKNCRQSAAKQKTARVKIASTKVGKYTCECFTHHPSPTPRK